MTTSQTPITDVSHVSISVSDLARSIRFYRDVLGWQTRRSTALPSSGWSAFPEPGCAPVEEPSGRCGWS